jgi:hypothetical protein
MSIKTQEVGAEAIRQGDVAMIDGQAKLIEDVCENGRMTGVWLCFNDGHDRFFDYNDMVEIVVDNM